MPTPWTLPLLPLFDVCRSVILRCSTASAALCWLVGAQAQGLQVPSPPFAALQAACTSPALLDTLDADALASQLQRCYTYPAYLARLGHLYNLQQRHTEAIEPLERALLFEPNNPDTQLDYALALAGSGDVASALNLVLALQNDPALPSGLRQNLARTSQLWASGAGAIPLPGTRISAGLRWGHDSNLLGAPNLGQISLTLPTETITLPLEASSLPRPSWFSRVDVRLHHTHPLANGSRWEIQAAALQRNSPRINAANSTQAELQLEHIRPASATHWGHYANASLASLQTHAGTRYRSQGLAAGLELAGTSSTGAAPACALRLGLDWQNRQLHSNSSLSGRYAGISGQWGCTPAGGQLYWQLSARAGQDRPQDSTRPGGAQNQYGVRAHISAASSANTTWLLDAEASHSRDATGYSPLLANNRQRKIHRFTLRLEVQHQLMPRLAALAGLEAVAQNASLPLFTLHSRGWYAGLRAQW